MVPRQLIASAALFWLATFPAAAQTLLLSDFADPETDAAKWSPSGNVVIRVEPLAATDTNQMMKVEFDRGGYPGFRFNQPPRDWSNYEALRFVVHAPSPITLHIRIDDANSKGYDTRYNRTFALNQGANLCQIETADIGRVLNLKSIRMLLFFLSSPPPGAILYFDDVALGELLSESTPFIPYSERMDTQPTLDVLTPHFRFAKPLPKPLNTFIMTSIRSGREVAELLQRIDMTASQMTWDRNYDQNTWGMGDFYGKRGHMFDFVLMQRYRSSSLQGPEAFDTLCIATPQGWDRFPKGARDALIERVRDKGEGLVLIFPLPGDEPNAPWPDDLKALSALIDS